MIFDDFVCKKNHKQLIDYFIRGRPFHRVITKHQKTLDKIAVIFVFMIFQATMKNLCFAVKIIFQKNNFKKQQKNLIRLLILISHGNLQQKTLMNKYNIYQLYIMSYSNGLLESTSTKIIEGVAGVGFKLTEDGNYDMDEKKIN